MGGVKGVLLNRRLIKFLKYYAYNPLLLSSILNTGPGLLSYVPMYQSYWRICRNFEKVFLNFLLYEHVLKYECCVIWKTLFFLIFIFFCFLFYDCLSICLFSSVNCVAPLDSLSLLIELLIMLTFCGFPNSS